MVNGGADAVEDGAAGDDGAENLGREEVGGPDLEEVAVEDDEIGEVSGKESAFFGFHVFCEGGGLRVSPERLVDSEGLIRDIGMGAVFTSSCDGSVEASKRRDGLERIVGAESQYRSLVHELPPGVGDLGSFRSDAILSPVHIGEEMIGSHRGDHAEPRIPPEVPWVDDLVMLDAKAKGGAGRNGRFRRIEGGKRHVYRPISHGVKANLEAGRSVLDGHMIQGCLIEVRDARAAGIIHIWSAEGGGAGAERAIEDALEHAGAKFGIVRRAMSALSQEKR